jgi:hypothetical protein
MTPYIIGFHWTIDGWRENRMSSGWKMKALPKTKMSFQNPGDNRGETIRMETALGVSEHTLGIALNYQDPPPVCKNSSTLSAGFEGTTIADERRQATSKKSSLLQDGYRHLQFC